MMDAFIDFELTTTHENMIRRALYLQKRNWLR